MRGFGFRFRVGGGYPAADRSRRVGSQLGGLKVKQAGNGNGVGSALVHGDIKHKAIGFPFGFSRSAPNHLCEQEAAFCGPSNDDTIYGRDVEPFGEDCYVKEGFDLSALEVVNGAFSLCGGRLVVHISAGDAVRGERTVKVTGVLSGNAERKRPRSVSGVILVGFEYVVVYLIIYHNLGELLVVEIASEFGDGDL